MLALLCAGGVRVHATGTDERGLPFVQTFRPRDYGNEHNQNWAAVQDRQGVLYVGNRDVVLSYDGFTWRSIPVGGSFVRGLAIDSNDRIWVGAVNELGYLDDDGRGGRVFTSLRDQLPENERDFGDIFQTFALPHGVYFVTNDRILWWHDGRFTVEHTGRALAQAAGDALVVHVRGQPLAAWRGADHRTVADFPELRRGENWVGFVAPRPDGAWILGTLRGGFWRLAGGKLTRFPTAADATLRVDSVTRGLQLRDGSLALALRPKGLLLLDPKGGDPEYLDVANGGLPNSALHGLFQDRDGDLWALLDDGLARITWPAHTTVFTGANGLDHGTLHAVLRHGDHLYVGAFDGLLVLRPTDAAKTPPAEAHFTAVPNCPENVLALASAGNELLVGGVGGLRVLSPDGSVARPWRDDVCLSLLVPRRNPGVAFVGTAGGLFLFRRGADGWHNAGPIRGIEADEIRNLVEAPDGALWASSSRHGFYRIFGLPGTGTEGESLRIEHYDGGRGLDHRPITDLPVVVATNADPLFLVFSRLYRFDARARRFTRLDVGAPGTRVRGVGTGANGSVWLRLEHDATGDTTERRQSRIVRLLPDGRTDVLPASVAQAAGQSLVFLEEPNPKGGSVLWVGGTEAALLRVELPGSFISPTPFRALIRRVSRPGGAKLRLNGAAPVRLPYAERALNFAFATDRLNAGGVRFEVRLDHEDQWSEPLSGPSISFTSLSPGRHLLAVRARDADARYSTTAEFGFVVLPAWWATWWAWVGYVTVAIAAFLAFSRWRLHALSARAATLEATVAARTEELRVAKTAAEAANRAKSAFLANMSHELRTPLNAILGFAQILRRSPDLSAEHLQRLAVIGRNGDHLLQLINEVLDLSKIEAGKLSLAPRPIVLLPVLQGIAETYATRAAEKGLGFETQFAADLPVRVEADDAKLRQVLHNLLGNALKFTSQGRIVFAVDRIEPPAGLAPAGRDFPALPSDPPASRAQPPGTQPNEFVRFTVTDSGVGIAADAVPRVFEAFYQAGDQKLATQGTGLGLTISQRIVGLMGGRLEVESTLGAGSRFHFAIPLPLPPAAAVATVPPRQVVGYLGTRRRLLIVDDEPANRDVLRALLEPVGFEIEEAVDSASCLGQIARTKFDGVLLDLRMGTGPDGYETARKLRALPAGRGVAIIAISASVFEEDRQTAVDAGCDTFVPKPFTEERLFGALADTMKLAWTYAPGTTPSASPFQSEVQLPAEDVAELLTLAHGGDVDALRQHLAVVGTAHPECAATVRHLDDLAANFKLTALRQALRQAGGGNAVG
ncbi:MAG TPA: ATP-binding protein [Opitutaceae bacterium]|nr:ATP-binding protein [Opitutaceae bacterium]